MIDPGLQQQILDDLDRMTPEQQRRARELVHDLVAASGRPATPAVTSSVSPGCGTRRPTSDLLIASTALSRRDELVTGNVRHFRSILRLIVHEDL